MTAPPRPTPALIPGTPTSPTADGLGAVPGDPPDAGIAELRVRLAAAQRALVEERRARAAAERAGRVKSDFLARMSHELRTPLNSILGFGQLLELSRLSEDDSANVALLLRAGRQMLGLVNDTLDICRIETGRLSLSLEPVHLGGLIEEGLDLMRPAAAARDVTLRSAPVGEAAFVRADRQRLTQVLAHLLSNAVKYNRHGGCVTVEVHPLPGQERLRVSITDSGVGIPADRLDDVFSPFDRLGVERGDADGAGIGLTVAKNLVEAMSGSIGLTSEVGRGSTFSVDLPAANPIAGMIADDDPPAPEAAGPAILYVEDNPANVTLVRRVLARRPELRLHVARDGMSGLEVARRERPDLLLLDLHLPQMDGMRVLTALRRDDDPAVRGVPVIVVTADLTPGTEQRLLQAGATAFLGKPFDLHTLTELVDRHLKPA